MPEHIPSSQSKPIQSRVQTAIASASQRTGVDFDYLVSQARVESNFNPSAKASTSSASGLYQFTRQTWLATVKEHGAAHGLDWAANAIRQHPSGRFSVSDHSQKSAIYALRNEPEAASAMAAEFAGDNQSHLQSALGRKPEPVDLYLAHFLGANGATRFLKAMDHNPDKAAAPLFQKAASANRGIFYEKSGHARSFGEIRSLFETKLNAKNPAYSVSPTARFVSTDSYGLSNGFQTQIVSKANEAEGPPLRMLGIEPMPQKLSIDFAKSTYERLEAMSWRTK